MLPVGMAAFAQVKLETERLMERNEIPISDDCRGIADKLRMEFSGLVKI